MILAQPYKNSSVWKCCSSHRFNTRTAEAKKIEGEGRMPGENIKYYIGLIVAMFFWGGSWVSAKILVEIAPPMTIGFFRFLIASVFFLTLISISGVSIRGIFRRENIRLLILLGLTGIFGYGVGFLIGMNFTTAAQGSIIAGFNPITISIFAHIIHKEKLTERWRYIGFLISFTGIVFVVGIQALLDFHLEYLIGNLIILGAMCMWGLYSSIGKEAMKTMTPLEMNAGSVVFGAIFFGVFALSEQPWNLPVIGDIAFLFNVFFLGVGVTVVGFYLYFAGINKLGATKAGGFVNFVPVFGTILSMLILSETIYWTFLVGLLLVITGVSIINLPNKNSNSELEMKVE